MKKLIFLLTALLLGAATANAQTWNCGYCGTSTSCTPTNAVTATFSNGVLTVSGSGRMQNFNSTSNMPWAKYLNHIIAVVVDSGVTHIGSYAFYNCAVLTYVALPNTLTSIGNDAFRASAIGSIIIPASVTSIGSYAFYNCRLLALVGMAGGTPPALGSNTFSGVNSRFCVGVLLEYLLRYLANSDWKSHLCSYPIPNGYYLVVFDAHGGSPDCTPYIVPKYFYQPPPDKPTRSCYVFAGWYTSASYTTEWNVKTPITANRTLYAKWEVAPVVTLNPQGGTVSPSTRCVNNDYKLASLPTLTRNGYIFNGWWTAASGGYQVSVNTEYGKNTTIYAQWIAECTVTFNYQGGTGSPASSTTYHLKLSALPTPTRNGYIFDGWWTAASGGTRITVNTDFPPNANITAYAHWITEYTVTFDYQGGTGGAASLTTSNFMLSSLPTPTRSIHSFAGWFTDITGGVQVTTSRVYSAHTTIYARWTYIGYNTITFNVCSNNYNGSISSVQTTDGGWTSTTTTRNVYPADDLKLTALPATKAASLFECGQDVLVGWFTAQTGGTQITAGANGTVFTRNTTVYAQWSWVGDYRITLNPNGGTVNPTYVTNSLNYHLNSPMPIPTRNGYHFDGWWTTINSGARVSNSNGVITNNEYLNGNGVHIHDNSWTFYARWIAPYTITFSCVDGGTVSPTTALTDANGRLTSLPTPIYDGNDFVCWRNNSTGQCVTTSTVFSANTTVIAHWSYTGSYTVSFNAQGGSSVASQTIQTPNPAQTPTPPTRTGYTFGGWYTDAACTNAWSFNTSITASITLYAKWTLNGYNVAYLWNNGTSSIYTVLSNVQHGSYISNLTPARAGYTFGGWYTDAACTTLYNFNTAVTANLNLYAKWTCNADVCCSEGAQFTIKIPFHTLPNGVTATYRWYRNGALIVGSQGTATSANTHIICTIPPNEAHGINVEFYFEYTLNDDHYGVWTTSPKYRVSFAP